MRRQRRSPAERIAPVSSVVPLPVHGASAIGQRMPRCRRGRGGLRGLLGEKWKRHLKSVNSVDGSHGASAPAGGRLRSRLASGWVPFLVGNPAVAPLTPWSDPGRQTFGSWEGIKTRTAPRTSSTHCGSRI